MTPEERARVAGIREYHERGSSGIPPWMTLRADVSWLLDLVERQEAELQRALEQYRKECDSAHNRGLGLYEQAMAGFNLARALTGGQP